jgi:hypothetical protein
MSETRLRSADRFNKRNQLVTAKKRPRHKINTPEGRKITRDLLFGPLAKLLDGKDPRGLQPDPPPKFLREPVRELVRELDGPWFLALAAIVPLLDGIFRGWDRNDRSWEAKLKIKIGDDLYWRLKQGGKIDARWSETDRVHAGNWLFGTIGASYIPKLRD